MMVSILFTPPAVLAGWFSGVAGQGDYLLAKVLFPYTMLSTHLTNEVLTNLFVFLAILQFPAYGFFLGLASLKRKQFYTFILLLASHVTAACLCFLWPMPNFM